MEYLVKPWQHQLDAIERAKSSHDFALFFEMGTGKTGTAINILRHKTVAKGRFLKTLIFCPPIVIPNWVTEFGLHSKIDPDRIVPLNESGQKRLKLFEANGFGRDPLTGQMGQRPCIFVTNYESLLMPALFQAMKRWGPEVLIWDESHRLKSTKARRSKLAYELSNVGDLRPLSYLLSGSPVLNSPLDLFQQYKIMDGGATFGTNYWIFQARFFEDKNAWMKASNRQKWFPNLVVRPGAVEEINELIFRSGMRVTKEECLDLPEEVPVTIKCGMLPEQRKHYEEMKRDFLAYVDGVGCAMATMALTKALRLMQITSGYLPLMPPLPPVDTPLIQTHSEPTKKVYEGSPKEEALEELLREITPNSKVLVWAVWKENYATIRKVCERLKLVMVEVHGEVSTHEQTENVRRFKEDPSVRVFLGHPGSGGIGINLTEAPYSIFYSRTFSLEHFLQARARNHRGGQKEKVTHYDLVCHGTIDEIAQNALAKKLDLSERLLKDISAELRGKQHERNQSPT